MISHENAAERGSSFVLLDRRFVTCSERGWAPYAMTAEEKAASAQVIARYHLNEQHQRLYESAFRQCLRWAAPAAACRAANASDLDRAAGHIVTPVLVGAEGGTH